PCLQSFFFLTILPPPNSTLFPYTTLFRSHCYCADEPVPDPQQPPAFCAPCRTFRTTQRAGPKTDLDAGIHAAAHFPRVARRVRPGAHRDWLDAAPRGPASR